ncbi:4-hydroxy-3-methylbut-2-enyl diphosphate reductase [Salinarimonas ramus]|uniref:4-hydroxy-3-methylbut-2-enyl diphosphate reductase n=1 Tax=Salinarimonas ramus TaxID=690164 RepID=A0A917V2L0_9HYPH|nr:4-hydroxy-3-methylbut-2-enyl diphosphate reductase [Salinarimonas ramus]GGK22639.1 4-hydroxy-3-methylbut-2-enyl diphosphate reductase [Salinarimonas ramus]
MTKPPLTVLLAAPRGFCAGVERAIDAVEAARAGTDRPVYVRHEIVHNGRVVSELAAKGVVFVDEVAEIPDGAVTIFSAHGVSRAVERQASERGLDVVDATCPLVRRVHLEGRRHAAEGRALVVIGHVGHAEVEGILGRIDGSVHVVGSIEEAAALAPADPERLAYVTQTTLSVDDTREIIAVLKQRFPSIVGPDVKTICYATQNRQAAVRALSSRAERIVVCGAPNSSNATRLKELATLLGRPARMIAEARELEESFLDGVGTIGLTAGASAPEVLVRETLARLSAWRDLAVEEVTTAIETTRFAPVDLGALARR